MTQIMLLFLLGSIQLSHEINEISRIRKLNLINLSIHDRSLLWHNHSQPRLPPRSSLRVHKPGYETLQSTGFLLASYFVLWK